MPENLGPGIGLVDYDSDGDIDLAGRIGSDVVWHENVDGKGTFGNEQTITTSVAGAQSAYAADLDNDGDMDVLSASSDDDKIAWYENIAGPPPTFVPPDD